MTAIVPGKPRQLLATVALLFGLSVPAGSQEKKDDDLDPAATVAFKGALTTQRQAAVGGKSPTWADAAQEWQKFITAHAKDPRVPSAMQQLGVCQFRGKKYAESARTFADLAMKHPKFEQLDSVLYNRGMALYNLGLASNQPADLKTAAAAFAETAGKFPKSKYAANALFTQGDCLYYAGDLAAAIPIYQKVLADYQESTIRPSAFYALGIAQQEAKRYKAAAATFQDFVKQYAKAEQADECRLRAGQCLYEEKQYAQAAPLLEQAAKAENFAHADLAHFLQAHCLYHMNQRAEAAKLFAALPQRFPKSARAGQAQVEAGKCHYEAGQFADARKLLLPLVDPQRPEAPEAAYWLAQALIQLKEPAQADTLLQVVLQAYPKSELAPQLGYVRINAIYEQPAKRQESVALYRDFAQKHPDHELAGQAAYMAAQAALRTNDFPAAQKLAEEFLAHPKFGKQPQAAEALFVAGDAYLRAEKSDPARAESYFRRLLKEHPGHAYAPQTQLRVGLCLALAKKHDEAIAFLTQSLKDLKDPALAAEAHLLIGRGYLDAGKAGPAAVALDQARQAKPDWERGDEVLLELARALRQDKKPADAADRLNVLASKFPRSLLRDQAIFQLGSLAYEQGKYADAIAQQQRLLKEFPQSPLADEATFAIGLAQLAAKDYKDSAQTFARQLEAYPNSPLAARARYHRGQAYYGLGQHQPAAADLAAFLAAKPVSPAEALHARHVLGLCQAGLKQYDQAAQTFAALLQEKPDYDQADEVRYRLAFALADGKKDKEAAAAFRELAAKHPDSPLAADSWFRVGRFQEDQKDLAGAAAAYAAGLQKAKEPELREKLQYKLGWALVEQGKLGEAAKVLQDQVKEHPKGELWADAASLAGDALFGQKLYADALPLYQQLIDRKDRKHLERALYQAGRSMNYLQKWTDSEKCFASLIQDHPKFPNLADARFGLAFSLQNQRKFDQAKPIFDEITRSSSKEIAFSELAARSRWHCGECAFNQKDYEEAIRHYLQAAEVYSFPAWQAQGYYMAGLSYSQLKDVKNARAMLQRVVEKYSKEPVAKDAARALQNLPKN